MEWGRIVMVCTIASGSIDVRCTSTVYGMNRHHRRLAIRKRSNFIFSHVSSSSSIMSKGIKSTMVCLWYTSGRVKGHDLKTTKKKIKFFLSYIVSSRAVREKTIRVLRLKFMPFYSMMNFFFLFQDLGEPSTLSSPIVIVSAVATKNQKKKLDERFSHHCFGWTDINIDKKNNKKNTYYHV